MFFVKSFILVLIYILYLSNCYANGILKNFTPYTSLTPELSGLVRSSDLQPVEIYTSEDIKLLGVENVPDLLRYISGINVYRVNSSTADISFRGFPNNFRINPSILVDGMEIEENQYNRTYMYNIPVTIDDIDRIEVIKDTSMFVNGMESPAGVINIVTKKPELLDSNYINTFLGTDNLINTEFSTEKYFFNSYFKLTGGYRAVNGYHNNKSENRKEFLSLTTTHIFTNSNLYIKGYISKNHLNLFDHVGVGVNHIPVGVDSESNLSDEFLKIFLIDYSFNDFDINFYFQKYSGFVKILEQSNTERNRYNNSSLYKISTKKRFDIKKFNVTCGIIGKYIFSEIETLGKKIKRSTSFYIDTKYNLFPNVVLETFFKNENITGLGNSLSYKLSAKYESIDKSFYIKAGYSKNFLYPTTFKKYFTLKSIMNYYNNSIKVNFFPNKRLRSTKIYSTVFNVSKRVKKFKISTSFFYNRIADVNILLGNLNLVNFQPLINLTAKNMFDFTLHGFESKMEYIFNNNFKFVASYYLQHVKDKTFNKEGNFLVPKYKYLSVFLFNFNLFSGSIKSIYTPAIKSHIGKNKHIFQTDITLQKNFLKNKITASISANNIFKDYKRDNYYGEKIGRKLMLKIKFNF